MYMYGSNLKKSPGAQCVRIILVLSQANMSWDILNLPHGHITFRIYPRAVYIMTIPVSKRNYKTN